MTLSTTLIRTSARVEVDQALQQLNQVNQHNKQELYGVNSAGFTCLQAIAGSSYFHSKVPASMDILNAILFKSKVVSNPDEHRRLLTGQTNAGFTPIHSAVNRGNYLLAIKLLEETRDTCTQPFAFSRLLSQKNNLGYSVYDTYKRNMNGHPPKSSMASQKNQPNPQLETLLFGDDYTHQQKLAHRLSEISLPSKPETVRGYYV
jgi:hypothetical protein